MVLSKNYLAYNNLDFEVYYIFSNGILFDGLSNNIVRNLQDNIYEILNIHNKNELFFAFVVHFYKQRTIFNSSNKL